MTTTLNLSPTDSLNIISLKQNHKKQNKAIMKNIIKNGLLLICLVLGTQLSAQYYPDIEYKKGDIEVAAGIGLMNTFIDKNTEAALPPVSITLGYRVKKTISVGTYLGYSKTNYTPPVENIQGKPDARPSFTNNYFQVGFRGQGHYSQDRLDFYGGAMIAYNFSVNDFENLGASNRLEGIVAEKFKDQVTFSGHIGMKYLLSEHVGIYGEVGYGVSIFNFGITTRL